MAATIAKALAANPQLGFRYAHVGKWHLSTDAVDPNLIGGWSHYSGFLAGEPERIELVGGDPLRATSSHERSRGQPDRSDTGIVSCVLSRQCSGALKNSVTIDLAKGEQAVKAIHKAFIG